MRRILALCLSLALLSAAPAHAELAVTETTVSVQVQGAVQHPGLYRLATGSRLAELIARAGGPRREAQLKGISLARRLQDGELVYVPTIQEARQQALAAQPPAEAPTRPRSRHASREAAPAGPVDLNTATAAQLDALPGIGPGLAAAIVQERQKRGRFRSIEDLREIQGIGKKRFERLRRYITVR